MLGIDSLLIQAASLTPTVESELKMENPAIGNTQHLDDFDWLGSIERGTTEDKTPIEPDGTVIRLPTCPDCDGRGWFLINPFETSPAPAGGVGNMTQCNTCKEAHTYFEDNGQLPPGLKRPKHRTSDRE